MLKKMSKKAKMIWGGVIALVVFGTIGNAIGGGSDEPQAAAPTSTSVPAPATTTAAPEPTTEAPAPKSTKGTAPEEDPAVYAQRIYVAWLESRGATTQLEVLAQSPDNIQGYLVSAESPAPGTVVFTAQLTKADVSKDDMKKTAMAVLQLVGLDEESLDRVEIVTADSLVRGVANRDASPLLTLNK